MHFFLSMEEVLLRMVPPYLAIFWNYKEPRKVSLLHFFFLYFSNSYTVEFNVQLILRLLQIISSSQSPYNSSQLSCLYSTETVLAFFGKLDTANPEPQPQPERQTASPSKSSQLRSFTSSIFSFFGGNPEQQYSPVPLENLSLKEKVHEENVINVSALADICKVLSFFVVSQQYLSYIKLYLYLLKVFPTAKLSILNTLTFSTPLTRSLWMWLCAYKIEVCSMENLYLRLT